MDKQELIDRIHLQLKWETEIQAKLIVSVTDNEIRARNGMDRVEVLEATLKELEGTDA